MCFQHLNIASPNAPENTCVFEALDAYPNLEIGLKRYADIVKEKGQTWRYTIYNIKHHIFTVYENL